MQSLRHQDDLVELKTELATVVEALDILHDFIDSVFGAKFQTFCGNLYQSQGTSVRGSCGSPREALRDLRWKHSRNNSRSDLLRRSSSSSSSTSQVFPPSSGGNNSEDGGVQAKPKSLPSFVSIERPENYVDVKLEIDRAEEDDVPDFLEDVDPFYGLGGDEEGPSYSSSYNYEDNEIKYTPVYQVHADTLASTDASTPDNLDCPNKRTQNVNPSPHRKSFSPARCIPPPGLIPISSESLNENSTYISSTPRTESHFSSSGSSDLDYQPTSSSKKSKHDGKKRRKAIVKKGKRESHVDSKPINSLGFTAPKPPSSIPPPHRPVGKFPMQKMKPTTGGDVSEGGPFKCNMCPASYKQEDSLRSHQKYKHNPSRVQCTCHLCGKSMVDKYRLQRHLRLHTGEKPFECQYCFQSFYRKDYHTKHLQRKHGIGVSTGSPGAPSTTTSPTGKAQRKTGSSKSPSPSSATTTTLSPCNLGPRPPPASNEVLNSPTTPPTATTMIPEEHSNFVNYFSVPPQHNSSSLTSSLITMTSLTFDDLISADL